MTARMRGQSPPPGLTAWALAVAAVLAILSAGRAAKADDLKILSAHLPPYSMDTDDGARGFVAEIAKEIARRVGDPAELHYAPFARVYKAAREQEKRLLAPVARTPKREDELSWVVPVFPDRMVVMTYGDDAKPLTLAEALDDCLIGVQRNSAMHQMLQARGVDDSDLVVSSDQTESARLLSIGRIDAWLSMESFAMYAMQEAGHDPDKLVYGETLRELTIYIGGSPGLAETVKERWRKAFRAMKRDGTYQRIMSHYGS